MEIITTVDGVRKQVKEWRKEGLSVGLVPTMGYLHEGHKSLIDKAVAENDRVVVSVFVNPIQFGPTEDLASYPRDLDRDAALCEDAGAALIFHPQPSEMYHDDFSSFVDMSTLTGGLCGDQGTLRKDKTDTFPRSMYGGFQIVPYCCTGPRLFWTERCPAVSSYPPHGARPEF